MLPRLPPGRPGQPRAVRAGALAVSIVLLAGCEGPSFGMPDAASAEGDQIRDLYRWFAALAAGVGVFVTVLLVYVVLRFRRRTDEIPDQQAYNIPIEVVYTVVPLLIVSVLFAYSVRTEESVNDLVAEPDVVVDVTGFQWQWRFAYPDLDVVVTGTPEGGLPELVLPVGQTTRLDLRSADVNHNFWVPAFLNKRDLIPGVDNAIDVTPTRLGTYDGVCAEYCGLDHGRMRFVVRVVDVDEFDRWVDERSDEAKP